MGLETLQKWGESSPNQMGNLKPLKTQPNNKYGNLTPKGIKFHSFYSNQTTP